MNLRPILPIAILGVCTACAAISVGEPSEPGRPEDVEAFAALVREQIEENDWQSLLSASDPQLYQRDVVAGGEEEVIFLASLLGLNQTTNNIRDGDELDWADLDRIDTAALTANASGDPPYRLAGFVMLTGGLEYDIEVWVTRVQGRFVLTAPPSES